MKRNWATDELIEVFTLTPNNHELLGNKAGATRLGFAILLKFFQIEAKFPTNRNEIPHDVVLFIAKQVRLPQSLFDKYKWGGRSFIYHKVQIREFFGFSEITVEDADNLTMWLCNNIECFNVDKVREAAYSRFRELKL